MNEGSEANKSEKMHKPAGKPLEFKDAVKFLRGALHSLNLGK